MPIKPTWDEALALAVWQRLSAEQQLDTLARFIEALRSNRDFKDVAASFERRLGAARNLRSVYIKAKSPEQLAKIGQTCIRQVMIPASWFLMLANHPPAEREPVFNRFAEFFLSDSDDEDADPAQQVEAPANLAAIESTFLKDYGLAATAHVFAVQAINGRFAFLRSRAQALLEESGKPVAVTDLPDYAPVEMAAEGFLVIDRVLINHIVAAAAREEGALDGFAVEDLVKTVIDLNAERKRSWFHHGFMDALLPDREPTFDRREMNEERRSWYVAGLMAGYARRNDRNAATRLLDEQRDTVNILFGRSSQASQSVAQTSLELVIDCNRAQLAAKLLKTHLEKNSSRLAPLVLLKIEEALRRQDMSTATLLLQRLREWAKPYTGEDDDGTLLYSQIERRWGQCLQASGNFDGAREVFEALVKHEDVEPGHERSQILADLGLVAGGFKRPSDIRLLSDPSDRERILEALSKGECHFLEAVEEAGDAAINAHFVLGILYYLRSRHPATRNRAERALDHLQHALTGIAESEKSSVYREVGILGQAQLALSVLLVSSADASQAQGALTLLEQIRPELRAAPLSDLHCLLEDAPLLGEQFAADIANLLWDARGVELLPELARADWLKASGALWEKFLELAGNEQQPRHVRWHLWSLLVPALIARGECKRAESGLDAMETLAEDSVLKVRFAEWLQRRDNYDPAWHEEDALWARARLYREAGFDEQARSLLPELFHLLRDRRIFEAMQILDEARRWGMPAGEIAALKLSVASEEPPVKVEIEQRLQRGEVVRVVFVGGNEIQAQYDEAVVEELQGQWPGVEVVFEHTGWSSNWGREEDRLIRVTNEADAMVLMTMMRTLLGRNLREAAEKPWIACAATGKAGMLGSLRQAVVIGLAQRLNAG